ncbi:TetR/AcrR family transcriptional regulator [Microbacterium sp. NPDC055683]
MSDDPRALRSRQRLQDALRVLLTREDLTEIGVAELCREAGVHRTTFYGHYTTVGDVAADLYASWLDEVGTVSALPGETLAELAARYADTTVTVLRSVTAERRTLRVLLASELSLSFRRRLQALFDERCLIAVRLFRERGLDVDFDDELAAAFVSGGIVGAILHWAGEDDADEEAYARAIISHMPPWWPRVA